MEAKEERVDVVSHLDVVEPGEGWEYDPFCAAVENGYLIEFFHHKPKGFVAAPAIPLKNPKIFF